MSTKIAINGFGRIGRLTFRNLIESDNVEIVAINDLTAVDMLAHLLKYDSAHGRFNGTVAHTENSLIVNGKEITVYAQRDPETLPWGEIGVETELRNLDASVFFGGDPGSPDTFQKFYADVEMYANVFDGTDPQAYLAAYRCGNEPKPSSQWQGENINRFCDPAYDALIDELAVTGDLEKRGEIAKKMNDMLTKESMTIVPLVDRGRVSAHANSLGGVVLNVFDSELWNVADWYRVK